MKSLMEMIEYIFGHEGGDLNALQMCCRTVVVFFLAMWMIRIAGRRSLGLKSAYDNVIAILLGAILSRAIVGTSPFIPIVCSGFALVIVYRWTGKLLQNYPKLWHHVKGEKMILYKDGKYFEKNMKYCLITHDEIEQQIRIQLNTTSFENIEAIYMEPGAGMSIVRKDK